MSSPTVTSVAEASPAGRAGLAVGDELVSLNGHRPTDVIDFHQLTDDEEVEVVVRRGGTADPRTLHVTKGAGEPLGVEVASAVFDRIRTCDNHCPFCFIYQLPKGMRRSLYLKDDDYRLSFLYGNFTTLTRFTELDAERVLDERLGPLFVSIHATEPELRARLLRNPKGATSLRWLSVLLAGGIEVHGQVVVCPGVNDGAALEDTMVGILDEYPELASVGVVPLGVSRYSDEPDMRPHTRREALETCATVARWQAIFTSVLGRRMVHAADEYYLMAGIDLPAVADYEGFPQHENGIGLIRAFEERFWGDAAVVDGAPAAGYRAWRVAPDGRDARGPDISAPTAPREDPRPVAVLTGTYAAPVLTGLLRRCGADHARVVAVPNDFFGGNIGVAGLLTGADLAATLAGQPAGHRYLLPDACLSEGRFLDGMTPADLPRPVEILATDGAALRAALDGRAGGAGSDGRAGGPGSDGRAGGAGVGGVGVGVGASA
jgi:putative radical SAM enzyme (TIGR03279 family)